MSLSRPMHLPPGGRGGPDHHHAECPAAEEIPEVNRIIVEEDHHLPVYISDNEEAEIDVVIDDDDAEGIIPVSSEDEDDCNDEDTDDSADWSEFSVDSGYESMSLDIEEDDDYRNGPDGDEESEGEEVEVIIYEDNVEPADSEDIPPPDFNPEDSSPSPSGPTSSTKRSSEESDDEPHTVKRQRTHEESPGEEPCSDDPASSTSGFHITTKRSGDGCWEDPAKRQRFCDESDSD